MTPHTCEQSERAFGKRVPGCPRCLELSQGSPVRKGWQGRYFEAKKQDEKFRNHLVMLGKCSCGRAQGHAVVCTAGEW